MWHRAIYNRICDTCWEDFTTTAPTKRMCYTCVPAKPKKPPAPHEKECPRCNKIFYANHGLQRICCDCRTISRKIEVGPIHFKQKEYFCEKFYFTCQSCGLIGGICDFDVHHIIHISRGGPHTEDNLTLLCGPCHRAAHKIRS